MKDIGKHMVEPDEVLNESLRFRKKGVEANKRGEHCCAMNFFSEALRINPGSVDYSNRSHSFFEMGMHLKAMDDAKEAICMNRFWFKGYYRFALALLELKCFEHAELAYSKAMKLQNFSKKEEKMLRKVKKCIDRKLPFHRIKEITNFMDDSYKRNLLSPISFIKNRDVEELENHYKKSADYLDEIQIVDSSVDGSGFSYFHAAVLTNDVSVTDLMLRKVDMWYRDRDGFTGLSLAVKWDCRVSVRTIIRRVKHLNVDTLLELCTENKNSYGLSVLQMSVMKDDVTTLTLLCESLLDMNTYFDISDHRFSVKGIANEKKNLLMIACEYSAVKSIGYLSLLEDRRGRKVFQINEPTAVTRRTSLHFLAGSNRIPDEYYHGRISIKPETCGDHQKMCTCANSVLQLLGNGADPNLLTSKGLTAFLVACRQGHLAVVRAFMEFDRNRHNFPSIPLVFKSQIELANLEQKKKILSKKIAKEFEGFDRNYNFDPRLSETRGLKILEEESSSMSGDDLREDNSSSDSVDEFIFTKNDKLVKKLLRKVMPSHLGSDSKFHPHITSNETSAESEDDMIVFVSDEEDENEAKQKNNENKENISKIENNNIISNNNISDGNSDINNKNDNNNTHRDESLNKPENIEILEKTSSPKLSISAAATEAEKQENDTSESQELKLEEPKEYYEEMGRKRIEEMNRSMRIEYEDEEEEEEEEEEGEYCGEESMEEEEGTTDRTDDEDIEVEMRKQTATREMLRGSSPNKLLYNEGFFRACQSGHKNVVMYLYKKFRKRGLDLDFVDEVTGENCLYVACYGVYPEIVRFLLLNGANPNNHCSRDSEKYHPLTKACIVGNISIVKHFLDSGVDLDRISVPNPFIASVRKQKVQVVRLMLRYKIVDVLKRDITDLDSLYYAVLGGNLTIVKLIVRRIEKSYGVEKVLEEVLRGRSADNNSNCLEITPGSTSGSTECMEFLVDYARSKGSQKSGLKISPKSLVSAIAQQNIERDGDYSDSEESINDEESTDEETEETDAVDGVEKTVKEKVMTFDELNFEIGKL